MSVFVLSHYPLSSEFRLTLETKLGERPKYATIAELRSQPVGRMVRALRSEKLDAFVLAFESPGALALRSSFVILASIATARKIISVYPDGRQREVSRIRAPLEGLRVVLASLDGRRAMSHSKLAINALGAAAPRETRLGSSCDIAYINGTSFLGAKAGGSLGHIAGVVNAFRQSGWNPTYWHAVPGPVIDDEIQSCKFALPTVLGFPTEANYYRVSRTIVDEVGPALHAAPPAFIYQRLAIGNSAGAELSHALARPLVTEYNGSEVWIAENWGNGMRNAELASAVENLMLRRASVIVTVSEILADELRLRGIQKDRIVWYPNCVDERVFDPDRFSASDRLILRERYEVPEGSVVAGFVGTFAQWHGVEVLARAIALGRSSNWRTAHGKRLHFLLVGDGVLMQEVEDVIASAGANEHVTFTRLVPQRDAPAHLAACDLLLSPHVQNADGSRFFGSPTKLFEYMAMEKPIIASGVEQLRQILRSAVPVLNSPASQEPNAVLVPPNDPRALWEAIEQVADDTALCSRIAKQARLDALTRFRWTNHVAAIVTRLRDLDERRALFA